MGNSVTGLYFVAMNTTPMNTTLAPAPATTGVGFNEYADRGSSMAAARAMADACPNLAARRGAMELLAPAGGMEQLEYALHFGADAVMSPSVGSKAWHPDST